MKTNTNTLFKTTLASTAIAGLLSFASVAQAGPNCGGFAKHGQKYGQMSDAKKSERMQKRMDRMATKLGLTDEQKTQVQALKQNSRNEIKPLRNERRALRREIRQLDPNASDYASKLADAANRQAEITRQLIIVRGTKRQQMSTILTPEQLAKKKEMRANRKARFHKRKHMRHHRKEQQS